MILIKNKPAGRKPILTKWITEDKRQNVLAQSRSTFHREDKLLWYTP
jgi:RecG-like helicase